MPDSLDNSDHRSLAERAADDWERHWAEFAEAAAGNPAQAYRRRLVLSFLSADGAPRRLLDIGSGSGDLARAALRAFPAAEVLGLESSRAGVDLARLAAPRATFLQRDLLTAEAPEPKYRRWATHAACSEVLEHVEEPRRLLQKAGGYLSPGCLVVVTVPGGPMTAFDRHIGHRRHFNEAQLRELLEQAGLQVERTAAAGFPFFNLYRLVVLFRGSRVVEDAVRRQIGPSRAARAAMSAVPPPVPPQHNRHAVGVADCRGGSGATGLMASTRGVRTPPSAAAGTSDLEIERGRPRAGAEALLLFGFAACLAGLLGVRLVKAVRGSERHHGRRRLSDPQQLQRLSVHQHLLARRRVLARGGDRHLPRACEVSKRDLRPALRWSSRRWKP